MQINEIRGDLKNPERVAAWNEAQEALVDLLQPWAGGDELFLREWEDRPMRVKRIRHPSGDTSRDRLVPFPKATDCRAAQRIIMGLLDRAGILVKRRTVSGPKRSKDAQEGQDGAAGSDEGPDPTPGAV